MAKAQGPFRIIAYVTGRSDIPNIGAQKLTHINYAFGHVSPNGEAVLTNPKSTDHIAQLRSLKSKNPHLKVILSIGGWGADNFSDASLTPSSRQRFADTAVDLLKRFELDGLDMDWEYPGQPGPGIKFRAEDKQNFTLWLQAVRRSLDALSGQRGLSGSDRYTLTIASADREYFDTTQMELVHHYLDWVNVMAYDFFGSLTATTGHHTALHRSARAPIDTRSTASSVRQHLEVGIPSHKLVVGAGFYGKAWSGVTDTRDGLFAPYDKYARSYSYLELESGFIDLNGFARNWDESAQAPYLWNADSRTFISYDDPQSLSAKCDFIRELRLGGLMYWEYKHDSEERLLDTVVDGLRESNSPAIDTDRLAGNERG